jgi:23S rRNA pseudouridine955/2504/2580 synthase
MIITKDYQNSRLDKFTSNHLNIPHSLTSRLLRKGKITVNGEKATINTRLNEGDEVIVPNSLQLTPKQAKKGENFVSDEMLLEFKSHIIFENEDFFAINKPAGLATQGGSKIRLSVDDFLVKINPEFRLVHRLDKETSGVLIIAKSRFSASEIAKDFKEKNIKKTYIAITEGIPKSPKGTIDYKLTRHNAGVETDENGKESITHYTILGTFNNFALLEIIIETGRMHQIRVHLASINCQIVGDEKYGTQNAKAEKMFLHSAKIQYKVHEIEAKTPKHFLDFIEYLKTLA